jgi:hypothetical protein
MTTAPFCAHPMAFWRVEWPSGVVHCLNCGAIAGAFRAIATNNTNPLPATKACP